MYAPLMSLVAVLGLAIAVADARAQELNDDLRQLQGTWRLGRNSSLGIAQLPTAGATGATYQEKISTIRIEGRFLTIGDSRLPVELRCGNVPALPHLPEGTKLMTMTYDDGTVEHLNYKLSKDSLVLTFPYTARCNRSGSIHAFQRVGESNAEQRDAADSR
jgi:hypothetical protein